MRWYIFSNAEKDFIFVTCWTMCSKCVWQTWSGDWSQTDLPSQPWRWSKKSCQNCCNSCKHNTDKLSLAPWSYLQKKKKEDEHLHILQIQNNNSVNLKWWAHVQRSLPFSFALVSILDIKTKIWATRCEVRDKVQLRPRSVLVSSGWPGCWRSGKPHLYRTRPPQWSTQSTAPGGTPHQHPSPSLLESHPQASLSAVPSSSSCSSGSSPAGFCNAAPPLSWLCSSSQTLLDTACGTSRAWTDTRVMCRYILKWQNLYKLMNVSLTITSNLSLKNKQTTKNWCRVWSDSHALCCQNSFDCDTMVPNLTRLIRDM